MVRGQKGDLLLVCCRPELAPQALARTSRVIAFPAPRSPSRAGRGSGGGGWGWAEGLTTFAFLFHSCFGPSRRAGPAVRGGARQMGEREMGERERGRACGLRAGVQHGPARVLGHRVRVAAYSGAHCRAVQASWTGWGLQQCSLCSALPSAPVGPGSSNAMTPPKTSTRIARPAHSTCSTGRPPGRCLTGRLQRHRYKGRGCALKAGVQPGPSAAALRLSNAEGVQSAERFPGRRFASLCGGKRRGRCAIGCRYFTQQSAPGTVSCVNWQCQVLSLTVCEGVMQSTTATDKNAYVRHSGCATVVHSGMLGNIQDTSVLCRRVQPSEIGVCGPAALASRQDKPLSNLLSLPFLSLKASKKC